MSNNDKKILDRVLELLLADGFEIVKAEGNPEYEKKLGSYKKTPDFIEYPFVGGGSPDDFFIDVKSPTGDYLFKKSETFNKVLNQAWEGKNNLNINSNDICRSDIDELIESLNKKTEKYNRNKSSLFGLIYYFDLRDSRISSTIFQKGEHPGMNVFFELDQATIKDDFQKELYLYLVFIPLLDSALLTGLIAEGIIKAKEWKHGVINILDQILLKKPVKASIGIYPPRMPASFLMLIIDLPNNVQQKVIFYNHLFITGKGVYENNKIIRHIKSLAIN